MSRITEASADEAGASLVKDTLVKAIALALRDGEIEIERAEDHSGRLHLQVEICLDRGTIPWHTASLWFDRRVKHEV